MLIFFKNFGLKSPAALNSSGSVTALKVASKSTKHLPRMLWVTLALLSILLAPPLQAANKKPKVIIAKIVSVHEGDTITLNGSASKDGDGSIANYIWAQTKGPQVSLNNPNSDTATFTAPQITKTNKPTKAINLSFKLTVTDNLGASKSKSALVKILPVNALPIANAGADFTTPFNTLTSLDAAGSTDDGQIVSYAWKQININNANKVKLKNAKSAQATFTSLKTEGTLEFQLTVIDNDTKKAVDTIKVTVSTNGGSTLNANFSTNKTTLNTGSTLEASIDSISGGSVPYNITFDWGDGTNPDQSTLESNVTTKSASHTYLSAGSYNLVTTLQDASGKTKTNTQSITVNTPALSAEYTLSNTVILEGDTVSAAAINIIGGSKPYKVKFEWGDGTAPEELAVSNDGNSQSANHSYAIAGEYSLIMTVTDNTNATKTFTVTVTVQVADPLGEC